MGRKSKLTLDEWHDIRRKIDEEGASVADLAVEYNISTRQIYDQMSRMEKIKKVAQQIVKVDREVSLLPISAQIEAYSLAARLKDISYNLTSAANYSAATAHRLAALANQQLQKIDESDIAESTETIKYVAGLQKLANESATIPTNLLNANKEMVRDMNTDREEEAPTLTELYKQINGQSPIQ